MRYALATAQASDFKKFFWRAAPGKSSRRKGITSFKK